MRVKKNQGFISLFQVNSRKNYALQIINYHEKFDSYLSKVLITWQYVAVKRKWSQYRNVRQQEIHMFQA